MTRLERAMYKSAWKHEHEFKRAGDDCFTIVGVSLTSLLHYWVREFPDRVITLKNILVVYDELVQNAYYEESYRR